MAVLLGVLVVAGWFINVTVGFPIIKTAGYRALIEQYKQARPLAPNGTRHEELKWNAELPLPNGGKARLQARTNMDVVRLQFPDETEPRLLYEYEDYSYPVAIRLTGDRLFVYWGETLLHTDDWLLLYDLRNRRELDRRRVDPKDMATE